MEGEKSPKRGELPYNRKGEKKGIKSRNGDLEVPPRGRKKLKKDK